MARRPTARRRGSPTADRRAAAPAGADRPAPARRAAAGRLPRAWCPGRAARPGSRGSTTPATTCAGWTGRSPRAPRCRTCGETIADRELETWVVVDLSASLDFGTARLREARPGDRRARRGRAPDRARRQPARRRRHHRRAGATATRRCPGGWPPSGCCATSSPRRGPRGGRRRRPGRGAGDAAPAAAAARAGRGHLRLPRPTRSDWERPLRGLARPARAARRSRCVDPRELELPDVGLLTVVDPESGQTLEVQTGDAEFRGALRRGRRRAAGRDRRRRCAGPAPGTCSCAPTATG